MKTIVMWLFIVLAASFTSHASGIVRCHVVDKGVVRCNGGNLGDVIYWFDGNGSYVEKTMVKGFDSYPKKVAVRKLSRPDGWPCLKKKVDGCYETVDHYCDDRLDYFIGMIVDGKPFCTMDTSGITPFNMMGIPEYVSWTECLSTTHLFTLKYNPIIDKFAGMNDFDGLPPGSYCEDFAATKELYWNP